MLTKYSMYKGSRIEWEVDECAQPYAAEHPVKTRDNPPSKVSKTPANRFQLLNMDDVDEEDDIAAVFQKSKKIVNISA